MRAGFLRPTTRFRTNVQLLKAVSSSASSRLLVSIPTTSGQQQKDSDRHCSITDTTPQASAQSVLYVYQHCDGHHSSNADEEEEPLEEIHHVGLFVFFSHRIDRLRSRKC